MTENNVKPVDLINWLILHITEAMKISGFDQNLFYKKLRFYISTEFISEESTLRDRKMSAEEDVKKIDLNNNNKDKKNRNYDQLNFLNSLYDPMFVIVVLSYGLTRLESWN